MPISSVTCRNCGHESHCGVPLIKDVTGFAETDRIEVCKSCKCERCTIPDWG